ncbi:MAG TPA: hypothetical protein VN766_02475 [Stellaceae bacterium]|jgi:hypothetical protein|nr:hypothetical protein [Stellaceae bacterium]
MRLTATLVKQTLDQLEEQNSFEDVYAIPEDNPTAARLTEVFGDHTFFVDRDGLHIVEALETQGSDRGPVGKVVKLARWKDKECTTLAPQKPVATDVIVLLGNPQQDDDEKQS